MLFVNRLINGPANINDRAVIVILIVFNISRVDFSPLPIRSNLLAPIFCPTKVEIAAEKFIAGITANESIRIATLYAAIVGTPKLLTIRYKAKKPNENNA